MKTVAKTLVHMHLPQTAHIKDNIEKLYKLFRVRALKKSKNKYVDKSENPVLMILNFNHPIFDAQVGVIVSHKSFKQIMNDKDEEIGFSVEIFVPFRHEVQVLTVYKIGKAFIEDKDELEKALQKKHGYRDKKTKIK
ncbi:MAG: hypothetical protein Q8K30_00460 [Candidatus Gracilibacteria bacterium]|nr:hypothetical protein [Candidatus Gracilibacteria bacterium]MDP2395464.1 hypothetical protein [bacterium]MDP3380426.1 hypothetical protein [bacterium]